MCATSSSVHSSILGELKCQTVLSCCHHLVFIIWKKIVMDMRKSNDKEMAIMPSQSLSCFLIPLWYSTPPLTLPTHSAVRLPWCYCLCYLKNKRGFKAGGLQVPQREFQIPHPLAGYSSVHTHYTGTALLLYLGTKSKQRVSGLFLKSNFWATPAVLFTSLCNRESSCVSLIPLPLRGKGKSKL